MGALSDAIQAMVQAQTNQLDAQADELDRKHNKLHGTGYNGADAAAVDPAIDPDTGDVGMVGPDGFHTWVRRDEVKDARAAGYDFLPARAKAQEDFDKSASGPLALGMGAAGFLGKLVSRPNPRDVALLKGDPDPWSPLEGILPPELRHRPGTQELTDAAIRTQDALDFQKRVARANELHPFLQATGELGNAFLGPENLAGGAVGGKLAGAVAGRLGGGAAAKVAGGLAAGELMAVQQLAQRSVTEDHLGAESVAMTISLGGLLGMLGGAAARGTSRVASEMAAVEDSQDALRKLIDKNWDSLAGNKTVRGKPLAEKSVRDAGTELDAAVAANRVNTPRDIEKKIQAADAILETTQKLTPTDLPEPQLPPTLLAEFEPWRRAGDFAGKPRAPSPEDSIATRAMSPVEVDGLPRVNDRLAAKGATSAPLPTTEDLTNRALHKAGYKEAKTPDELAEVGLNAAALLRNQARELVGMARTGPGGMQPAAGGPLGDVAGAPIPGPAPGALPLPGKPPVGVPEGNWLANELPPVTPSAPGRYPPLQQSRRENLMAEGPASKEAAKLRSELTTLDGYKKPQRTIGPNDPDANLAWSRAAELGRTMDSLENPQLNPLEPAPSLPLNPDLATRPARAQQLGQISAGLENPSLAQDPMHEQAMALIAKADELQEAATKLRSQLGTQISPSGPVVNSLKLEALRNKHSLAIVESAKNQPRLQLPGQSVRDISLAPGKGTPLELGGTPLPPDQALALFEQARTSPSLLKKKLDLAMIELKDPAAGSLVGTVVNMVAPGTGGPLQRFLKLASRKELKKLVLAMPSKARENVRAAARKIGGNVTAGGKATARGLDRAVGATGVTSAIPTIGALMETLGNVDDE